MRENRYLALFRLSDRLDNKSSLRIEQRPDGVLSYSLYGGWQHTGTGYAIENLYLKSSLPVDARLFVDVHELVDFVEGIVDPPESSDFSKIKSIEILNNIEQPEPIVSRTESY